MVKSELTTGSGIITMPFHSFVGSNQRTQKAQNQSDDISYSGSLIEKTFITWVNYGTDPHDYTAADNPAPFNSNEIKMDGGQYIHSGGA